MRRNKKPLGDYFCGRSSAEDIGTNLKEEFSQIENLQLCSPDTLLRVQKSLAFDKEIDFGKSGSVNDLCKHAIFNELNLDMLLQSKTLRPNRVYDLILTTNSSHAKNTIPKGVKNDARLFPWGGQYWHTNRVY